MAVNTLYNSHPIAARMCSAMLLGSFTRNVLVSTDIVAE